MQSVLSEGSEIRRDGGVGRIFWTPLQPSPFPPPPVPVWYSPPVGWGLIALRPSWFAPCDGERIATPTTPAAVAAEQVRRLALRLVAGVLAVIVAEGSVRMGVWRAAKPPAPQTPSIPPPRTAKRPRGGRKGGGGEGQGQPKARLSFILWNLRLPIYPFAPAMIDDNLTPH